METLSPDNDQQDNAEVLHTRVKEMLKKLESLEDLILCSTKKPKKGNRVEPEKIDDLSGLHFSDTKDD